MMNINSLYDKEIIWIIDGARIGEIFDLEIEENSGVIISIIVLKRSFWFCRKEKQVIPWSQVKVIGNDTF